MYLRSVRVVWNMQPYLMKYYVKGDEIHLNPICLGGGAQCALLAVIALKTQKNEKKFLKKVQICPTHHPPRSPPSPTFHSMYRDG